MPDPIDPSAVYLAISDLLHWLAPGATDVRLTFTVKGREGIIPIPMDRTRTGPTGSQQRILDVARASVEPLTRKAIARRLDIRDTRGRFGQDVRDLIALGLLHENDGEVTDDPAKFGTVDQAQTPAPV